METEHLLKNEDILTTIYKRRDYMNPALQRIADFILGNPGDCKTMAIKDLASACDVAESTVTRFVKELPLPSYQELKIKIAEAVLINDPAPVFAPEKNIFEDISPDDSTEVIADKICYKSVDVLNQTRRMVDTAALERAAHALAHADNVIFMCMGSSAVSAEEARMRFTRVGKKCVVYRDDAYQQMTAAITNKRDVIIGISNSGRTTSIVEALRIAQERGATTIGITSFSNSPLVKYSDIALFTPTKAIGENSSTYWESSSSKMAQIYIVDLLYVRYASLDFEGSIAALEDTYRAMKHMRLK